MADSQKNSQHELFLFKQHFSQIKVKSLIQNLEENPVDNVKGHKDNKACR